MSLFYILAAIGAVLVFIDNHEETKVENESEK